MKAIFGCAFGFFGVIFLIIGVGWIAQGSNFFMFSVFAPRYEAVRRQTFEQSKAYNQGVAQDLQAAQLDYLRASPDQQSAIASVILHRIADYDTTQFPPDLQAFVAQLRTRSVVP